MLEIGISASIQDLQYNICYWLKFDAGFFNGGANHSLEILNTFQQVLLNKIPTKIAGNSLVLGKILYDSKENETPLVFKNIVKNYRPVILDEYCFIS